MEQLQRGTHSLDAGQIQAARLIPAAAGLKTDFALSQKFRAHHIPRAEQRRPQLIPHPLPHHQHPRTDRPQHPLVGIRRQKVGFRKRGRQHPEGLDSVEAKQDVSLFQLRPDDGKFRQVAAEIVGGGQADQPGPGGDQRTDGFPKDGIPRPSRDRNRPNAFSFQLLPGINVGRVVEGIENHLIAGFPSQSQGHQPQPEGRRPQQRNLLRLTSQKTGGHRAGLGHPLPGSLTFLPTRRGLGTPGIHRLPRRPGDRGHRGMGQKDPFAGDREEPGPFRRGKDWGKIQRIHLHGDNSPGRPPRNPEVFSRSTPRSSTRDRGNGATSPDRCGKSARSGRFAAWGAWAS